ncbi:zinc-binding alcohol dehydrogenase family protein [candidate division GN15 bacterium]|nr:zinc-binding alcohol dehydrogenase family protein [candidate division GN15 bacterium]
MKAMILDEPREPMVLREVETPQPGEGQVQIRVYACGVCRTDLHVVDGELSEPVLPLIPGHQIVGRISALGPGVSEFQIGERVGVPWLGYSCGECFYCRNDQENLCEKARYTGYQIHGGFAEFTVADERFCFPIPESYPDLQAAPLLCAGLIGYRSYRMTDRAQKLGFYGFGAAAHILIQLARWEGREIYAFVREGDDKGAEFARNLGATWAGYSGERPPVQLDAAIIFAPVGSLVPASLKAIRPGGVVVCAGIYMSEIPAFSYDLLWMERQLRSVANLTRRDGEEFLALAPEVPVQTEVHPYSLDRANEALDDLRAGRFDGAAVVTVKS